MHTPKSHVRDVGTKTKRFLAICFTVISGLALPPPSPTKLPPLKPKARLARGSWLPRLLENTGMGIMISLSRWGRREFSFSGRGEMSCHTMRFSSWLFTLVETIIFTMKWITQEHCCPIAYGARTDVVSPDESPAVSMIPLTMDTGVAISFSAHLMITYNH